MALLEVVDESVEVGEVEPTAGVVAALRADEMTNAVASANILLTSSSWRSSMASAFMIEPRSLSMEEDILPSLMSLGLEWKR